MSCGGALPSAFEDPKHMYDAFEVTLNKRFWRATGAAIASYRFSQLEGNFEGFFRSDNGQSDPAITSLFDFPTNDPSYTARTATFTAAPATSATRATRSARGVLPNDRPHQLKLYGNYVFGATSTSASASMPARARSLTALAAKPGVRERRGNSLDAYAARASTPSTAS